MKEEKLQPNRRGSEPAGGPGGGPGGWGGENRGPHTYKDIRPQEEGSRQPPAGNEKGGDLGDPSESVMCRPRIAELPGGKPCRTGQVPPHLQRQDVPCSQLERMVVPGLPSPSRHPPWSQTHDPSRGEATETLPGGRTQGVTGSPELLAGRQDSQALSTPWAAPMGPPVALAAHPWPLREATPLLT